MSNSPEPSSRRDLFTGAIGGMTLLAGVAQSATSAPVSATSGAVPIRLPQTEFLYEAVVELLPVMDLGKGPLGERRMIPITGGTFEGPGIKGKVLSGGADRQLWRADGARYLDALYEMQTDDGAIITVHNKVFIRTQEDGQRYAFSHVDITAPEGKYGWLNNAIYLGTLHSLPNRTGVTLVRVYKVV